MKNISNQKIKAIIAIFALMFVATIVSAQEMWNMQKGETWYLYANEQCLPIKNAYVPSSSSSPEKVNITALKNQWPIAEANDLANCAELKNAANLLVYKAAKNGTKTDRPTRMLDAITKAKERVPVGGICGDLVKVNRGYRWHKVLNNTRTAVCK